MATHLRLLGTIVAAGLFASLPASAQPMHYNYETPEQNVARSAHYDWLLETDLGFRSYRMRKECDPIDFVPALRQDCFASFDQFEPVR
jgi:hypothetical protein